MGRRPQPQIKEELIEACVDHALAHGLPDRLATIAEGTGTSSRMLIYHFGTRDALLLAVLHRARVRQVEAFTGLLAPRDEPYADTLDRAWASISGAGGEPYLQVFGQWRASVAKQLWPDFPRAATTDWLGPLADGLGSPELATLALAVIRGLLMDLDATGDRERVDLAFDAFTHTLRG